MKMIFGKQAVVISVIVMMIGTSGIVAIGGTFSGSGQSASYNESIIEIVCSTDEDVTTLTYNIKSFTQTPVKIEGEDYFIINLANEPNSLDKGMPDIPRIRRSIIIPDTAKMSVQLVDANYETYKDVALAPSKGNILRTQNPDDISYEFGKVYTQDAWYPQEIVTLNDPYILRDYRGQVVEVCPFQYNPVTNELRFYTDITVIVSPEGKDNVNCFYRSKMPETVSIDFLNIYNYHFLNFDMLGRYELVPEEGNMLVITYDAFYDAMIPFVEWKNMKGIPTDMVNVSTIGNANAIKDYIIQYYDTNGLTFVLLVGDINQIPSLSYSGYASDPSYACIVGDDHYQDLFVGRFSANNLNQLETQIIRSINYEKNPEIGGEWYHRGHGVASNQGPGHGGLYDHQHMDLLRSKLLNFTYTEVSQSYDPWGTTTINMEALNTGVSILNYCGHGWYDSWGNGGSFNINNVNNLVNDNMLPYITLVACLCGAFDSTSYEPCFAEAWMRATNDATGEPTGAIGVFASTKSQAWNPPMAGQLEIVNLLVNGINTAIGALSYHGTMYMVDQYPSGGPVEARTWTLFGDPSLQIRTDTPASMTITHDPQVGGGSTSFEITVSGVEHALCAISLDAKLLGYAYTDASGYAVIEFEEPIPGIDPVTLVVTAFNKETYITTLSLNIPPEKPITPIGPSSGKPGSTYLYKTSTVDPDGDQVYYFWDWGDGTYSDWLGPHASGVEISTTHTWSEEGTYLIRVKAKDTNGGESVWSDPIVVNMPTNQRFFGGFINRILVFLRQMSLNMAERSQALFN